MLLSDILYENEYTSRFSAKDVTFSRIVSDTAELEHGALFVCLEGTRYDAHALASLAVMTGASAIIAKEGKTVTVPPHFPVFFVRDTREMLAHLCNRFYRGTQKSTRLIAITGTNGKTSTLYLCGAILRASGYSVGMIGTVDVLLNGQPLPLTEREHARVKTMTTPDPTVLYAIIARMETANADFILMEASSHALALGKLAALSFDVGMFLNLSSEHMDFHRDMESYLSAKASLFPLCRRAIFNADSPYSKEIIARTSVPCLLCGEHENADFRTANAVANGVEGTAFELYTKNAHYAFSSTLIGHFNLENVKMAVALALSLGIDATTINQALQAFEGIPGRMERQTPKGYPFTVLIDYAHTEEALRRLLETLKACKEDGERIVLLFGCGGDRDKSKRDRMGTVAEMLADFTVVTSDNPRTESKIAIIKDILRGMPNKQKRRVITDRRRAIAYVLTHAEKGDVILLTGKGHESYEITSDGILPFSERKIVADFLQNHPTSETSP